MRFGDQFFVLPFKTRSELKNYFATARKHIRPGESSSWTRTGKESFEEQEEERDLDGFIYVWDQNHYNPITGDVINHITSGSRWN